MKINVHAGHAAVGKGAIGAVGILNESKEDRIVKELVIKKLKMLGNTVYDCTVDTGDAKQVLTGIVKKCNAHKVDLDVSIHFNAGANDALGNGQTTGTEVLVYSENSSAYSYATKITNSIAKLGFKNRGVKKRTDLYFLKNTKSPSLLIECCFVDDKDDAKLYNAEKMANAIVEGITGFLFDSEVPSTSVFKVRTKDNMNIRTGPGTLYKTVGVAPIGTYTIVDTKGNWGKLLSGAGWINISIKYATRM